MNVFQITYSDLEPYYVQIVNHFRKLILRGQLVRGQKLPNEQELKQNLGVHRKTLRQALSLLEKEGLVRRIPRKGNYIAGRTDVARISSSGALDFCFARLAPLRTGTTLSPLEYACRLDIEVPYHSERLHNCLEKAYQHKEQWPLKILPAADSIKQLKSRIIRCFEGLHGVRLKPSQMSLVQGEYDAYRNVLALFSRCQGEYILMRRSCNTAIQQLTRDLGFQIKFADGANESRFLDRAAHLLKKCSIKAIYIESRCDHSFCTSLSEEGKVRLLSLAARYHVPIIEVDYDRELDAGPFQPLFFKDPSRVIYISCASKTLDFLYDLKVILAHPRIISSLRHLNDGWSVVRERCLRVYAELLNPDLLLAEVAAMRRSLGLTRSYFVEVVSMTLTKDATFSYSCASSSIVFYLPFYTSEALLRSGLRSNGICHRELRSECTVDMPFKMLKVCFSCMPRQATQALALRLVSVINESVQCSISRSNESMYHAAAVQLA